MIYEHTQNVPSKTMTFATAAGFILGLTPPGWILRLAVWGTLGAAAAIFKSLTVSLTESDLKLEFGKKDEFGSGLIKKLFPLAEISAVTVVRTKPVQGWGIHYIGNGWLYNVYGLDAVQLSLKNGTRAVIGTDDAENLAAILNQTLADQVA